MLETGDFLTGLIAGGVLIFLLVHVLRRRRRTIAGPEVAPSVLMLELKRAKRLGHSIALLLFRPGAKKNADLRRWLNTIGEELKLREYDLLLQWDNDELVLVLPCSKEGAQEDALRRRFDRMLLNGGWKSVPYGIAVYPQQAEQLPELIGRARDNSHRPKKSEGRRTRLKDNDRTR